MIKKIFVGILLAAVFGLLILGAVNRTLAKTVGAAPLQANENLNQQRKDSFGEEIVDDSHDPHGTGKSREPISNTPIEEVGVGGHDFDRGKVDAWVIETGDVASVDTNVWMIQLDNGFAVEFEGRMLSYLIQQGFSANIGDSLVLTGFYEDESFEIGQVYNTSSGVEMFVRDDSGHPLWAGMGRGKWEN